MEVEVFGRGGLTHYVYCLSKALGENGHEVIIATAADYELSEQATELPDGVRVVPVFSRLARRGVGVVPGKVLRSVKGVEFFADSLSVLRLIAREAPDIVHVHCTNQVAAWLMWLLRRCGRPVVWTVHDVTPHESFTGQTSVYRSIYHGVDGLIAHSERDRTRLIDEFDVPASAVEVIPHGDYQFFATDAPPPSRSDARRELGITDDAPVALFFGFIREYKGLDVLFDAWPAVLEADPDARLVVVGDPARLPGDVRRDYERRADELGVIRRFEYVPFEDVNRYLALSDVLVLPYRKISQSGVLMLAMSVGLPVVATRVGAFPEVIESGRTGMLVEPGSVSELAAALSALLSDDDLRGRLSEASRLDAEARFSWDAIAANTVSFFDTLIESEST